jgi:HK97 family phage major capsid protein
MDTELKTIVDDINTGIEKKADITTVEKLTENVNTLTSELASKSDEILKLAEKMEGMKHQIVEAPKDSLTQIKSMLEANKENLAELKSKKVSFDFHVKSAGTMTFANSITGEIPQAQRLVGVNNVPNRLPFVAELVSAGVASSNLISWVEEVTGEGDANYTAEGDKKNQTDVDYKTASEKIHKITVFIKVSEEMLNDIDFMATEINSTLLRKLNLKIDAELLKGAGGGSAINGILTQATAWAAGTFALKVSGANMFDVLRTAINQVYINHGVPNFIVMHPSDVTAMSLTKDKNDQYLFPSFTLPNGQVVAGIPIVANTGMTVDNFLVMDGTKATMYVKENVRIEAGWENDDFTRNLRTILAEARLNLIIKGNDKKSFVKGVFATAITALTPSAS